MILTERVFFNVIAIEVDKKLGKRNSDKIIDCQRNFDLFQ